VHTSSPAPAAAGRVSAIGGVLQIHRSQAFLRKCPLNEHAGYDKPAAVVTDAATPNPTTTASQQPATGADTCPPRSASLGRTAQTGLLSSRGVLPRCTKTALPYPPPARRPRRQPRWPGAPPPPAALFRGAGKNAVTSHKRGLAAIRSGGLSCLWQAPRPRLGTGPGLGRHTQVRGVHGAWMFVRVEPDENG
jgi:hypothetical protein